MDDNLENMAHLSEQQKIAHRKRIIDQVDLVVANLPGPFNLIMDIGAGIAEQAREFQSRFGSEIYLIEGHRPNNVNKAAGAAKSKWQEKTENFLYYWDLDVLKTRLEALGTTKFHLVDCEKIDIPADVKFDLICSWKSCGYHYSVDSYLDLIRRHSHSGTRIVMDIRNSKAGLRRGTGWQIVKELYSHGNKYKTCILELVN